MSGAEADCMEAASHNWLLSEPWHEGPAWPRWGPGSTWLLGVVGQCARAAVAQQCFTWDL